MSCGSCSKVNYTNFFKKEEEKTKVGRIIEGWYNLLFSSKQSSDENIVNRAKICFSCEKNKMKICSECGCFIPAKINSLTESCPLNKWISI